MWPGRKRRDGSNRHEHVKTVIAYIGLGSNLGDRRGFIERALDRLRDNPKISVCHVSTLYETEPVGVARPQPAYLNGVAEIQTSLSADELMQALLAVESEFGRTRAGANSARTIDLDLLLWDHSIQTSATAVVPHPRLHERRFVLQPLADLAPAVVHPVIGKTVRELLDRLPVEQDSLRDTSAVRELVGFRALVTGSTSGIGLAIARAYLRAGATVIGHGRSTDRRAPAGALGESRKLDGFHPGEFSSTFDFERFVEEAWRDFGPLDIWVNNAGADTLTGAAAAWPFERKLQALWEVDVLGTIQLSRAIGARMYKRGSGVIINMGWDQAEIGMDGDSGQLFASSKGAIMSFTKSLAVTLAPNVRVNCLAPGWIRTAWGERASSDWHERVRRETLMGRWGTVEDVASAACWLASPAASFMTGQVIRVNGGAIR
jgi:2-amino-4-hydroxy-6-hydroxymethyldihydropteridine diphosphokinase